MNKLYFVSISQNTWYFLGYFLDGKKFILQNHYYLSVVVQIWHTWNKNYLSVCSGVLWLRFLPSGFKGPFRKSVWFVLSCYLRVNSWIRPCIIGLRKLCSPSTAMEFWRETLQEAQRPHRSPELHWLNISHINTCKVTFLYCGPNCSETMTLATWFCIGSPCK
jgi:hypothetical protein